MATQVHSAVLMWPTDLRAEGGAVGACDRKDIDLSSKWRLPRFAAQYEGM